MKYPKIFLCALLFAQFAGCALADSSRVKPSDQQAMCAKSRAPACKRHAPPVAVDRSRTLPPLPAVPATTLRSEPPAVTVAPPNRSGSPLPLTSCDAGGCWDAGANRYSGGAANSYLDKNGRLCNRNGAWVQCF